MTPEQCIQIGSLFIWYCALQLVFAIPAKTFQKPCAAQANQFSVAASTELCF